jgi:hypothetical protein
MCLTIGVVGLGAVGGARAATPSSLAGETFSSSVFSGTSISGFCNGGNGSLTFSFSGTATGPYPGTYTESGSLTITGGTVTAFSATFTITSSAGSVTGSKILDVGNRATCIVGDVELDSTRVSYTATIKGAYRDTGTGSVSMSAGMSQPDVLNEAFSISNGVVPTAGPLAQQLVNDSTGVGPGKALLDKASAIQTAVNANQTATACADITDYLGLVKAQTGKKLSTSTAMTLTNDADNLSAALGCT